MIAKEVFIKLSAKYAKYSDVFFLDLAFKLSKHTEMNNHAIELVDSQQLPYVPIYSLKPGELKTLKIYIEINLANRFI